MEDQNKIKDELLVVQDDSKIIFEKVKAIEITSQEKLLIANKGLDKIRSIEKEVISRKKTIFDPKKAVIREWNNIFKPTEDYLSEAKQTLKEKVGKYMKAVEKRTEEQREALEKKIESGEVNFEEGIDKMSSIEGKKDNFRTREHKVVEIEDETKIPRSYLIPDMVLIRRDALAGVKIDGVKVVIEKIIL